MSTVTSTIASPGDDLLARLPEPARDKLEALRRQRDDARALLDAAVARVEELSGDLRVARRELQELERADEAGRLRRRAGPAVGDPTRPQDASPEMGGQFERDEPRLEAARQRVQRLAEQHEQAGALRDRRSERWQRTGSLVRRIEEWLGQTSRRLAPASAEPPKLAKNADLMAEIERVRDSLSALIAERKRVANAPCTAEEAMDRARRFVAARGERFKITGLLSRAGPRLPQQDVGGGVGVDPFDMQCWMDPQGVLRRLEKEIEARAAEHGHGLSELDQARQLRDIDDRMLAAERREEALVVMAEQQNLDALRRSDASPLAVLGVE